MCASVCLCVPVRAWMCLSVPGCACACLGVPLCACVCLCVPGCTSVCLGVPLCSWVCLCVPQCVPMCASVCAYMCLCVPVRACGAGLQPTHRSNLSGLEGAEMAPDVCGLVQTHGAEHDRKWQAAHVTSGEPL